MQLPAYAYIPGQNQRHPEGAFDAIRNTAVKGLSADQLAQSDAFQAGLQFIEAGFYWEAHEVLEAVWMVLPVGSVERNLVEGLIQLANGHLKLHMGKPKATFRLIEKARALVPEDGPKRIMGLELPEVRDWVDRLHIEYLLAI